ncbi:MAG: hypothetical protein ACREJB_14115, partial [Planctomycetaceae bacterium]
VRSLEELRTSLDALADQNRWVVKAEFGMSARERILGRGREITDAAANWLRQRLRSDGIVFFEPWVERVEEAGLQLTIRRNGEIEFDGLTPLLTDGTGQYRGNDFTPDAETVRRWTETIEIGRRAAGRIAAAGYFGPLGIDAMRYRAADGTVRLRPLQDVNARCTMGRLGLGFRRLLRPGEAGVWRQERWSFPSVAAARSALGDRVVTPADGMRTVRTSPLEVGGRPSRIGTRAVLQSPVS